MTSVKLHSVIVCSQAAAVRLRRQPMNPKKPRADSRSGRAAGMGTGAGMAETLTFI